MNLERAWLVARCRHECASGRPRLEGFIESLQAARDTLAPRKPTRLPGRSSVRSIDQRAVEQRDPAIEVKASLHLKESHVTGDHNPQQRVMPTLRMTDYARSKQFYVDGLAPAGRHRVIEPRAYAPPPKG
jgi:hypothetical protein